MSLRPSRLHLTSPGDVQLYSTAELLNLPKPSWLIDGVIPSGSMVGLYGAPGVAKTFLAMDMALAIACGDPWQGLAVDRDNPYVLYISAEGGVGIGQRASAWLSHHLKDPTDPQIAWLLEAIQMHLDEAKALNKLVERLTHEVERVPVLVVIDTLARCFVGDENQQVDMGAFVAAVDWLREKWGCTVLVVHHTNRKGDSERGSIAFRGAADTMIRVQKVKPPDGVVASATTANIVQRLRIECTKQKDAEEFKAMHLRLVRVPTTNSCVIAGGRKMANATPIHPGITQAFHTAPDDVRQRAHDLLMIMASTGSMSRQAWADRSGLPFSTFLRYVSRFAEYGLITEMHDGDWTIPQMGLGDPETGTHHSDEGNEA